MIEVPKIGKAKNVKSLLDDLANDHTIEELITVRVYRDETGTAQFRYDHTGLASSFRVAGALLWAANAIVRE
jgi:hypothetical protein